MTVSQEKKQRLSVYLDPDLKRRLADFADRQEQSASLIAEAAIASFLSPDADERKEAAIVKRLNRIDRCVQRLERDLGITSEALALFIRSCLVRQFHCQKQRTSQLVQRSENAMINLSRPSRGG